MKVIKISLCILMLFLICGCRKQEKTYRFQGEILTIVNNDLKIDELITKTFTFDRSPNLYDLSLEQIDRIYRIECLRSSNDNLYSVFKLQNNYMLLVLFKKESNIYVVKDYWLFNKLIYTDLFRNLEIGQSTVNDVKNIDTYGNYVLYAQGLEPSSTHYTIDGDIVRIKYGDNFVVSEIEIIESSSNSLVGNILPLDQEAIINLYKS